MTKSSDDKILEFFMNAARVQALIHTGEIPPETCEHGVKIGDTCVECAGAALPNGES